MEMSFGYLTVRSNNDVPFIAYKVFEVMQEQARLTELATEKANHNFWHWGCNYINLSRPFLEIQDFFKNHESFAPKRYTYSNVRKMADSFKVKVGEGGYGSVCQGTLPNGNSAAVKLLNELKVDYQDTFCFSIFKISRPSIMNGRLDGNYNVSSTDFCHLEGVVDHVTYSKNDLSTRRYPTIPLITNMKVSPY
ncbi:Concanavalin A-like lectin/glucanase, subgroup [Artemisia annua]|uniref:Concanavalin A-like lectin/glucanase, subgroup n=1 Tax=Artemisia annua TaxID=35608 RepID=A0A2U1NSE5_ARTAN|nr:Concanavalin A-like lectin/glucanase, subgroup [Artemisia annua]